MHILFQDLSSFCGHRDTQKRDSWKNKNGPAAFLSYWSEGVGEERKKTSDVPLEEPDPLLTEVNRLFAQIWD